MRELIKEGDRIRTVINQSSLTNVFSTVLDLHRTYYPEGIFVAQLIITVMVRRSCRRVPLSKVNVLGHYLLMSLSFEGARLQSLPLHHVALDEV